MARSTPPILPATADRYISGGARFTVPRYTHRLALYIACDITYDMAVLRYVLDTDVVVAALRSPTGASAALLNAADHGVVQLLASVPLAIEYEAQCTSAKHWAEAGLTEEQASIFVDAVINLVEPVETFFLWRPQLRDPGDEMVLEAAINGRAHAIVTFNQKDYGESGKLFEIDVIKPSEAIMRTRV